MVSSDVPLNRLIYPSALSARQTSCRLLRPRSHFRIQRGDFSAHHRSRLQSSRPPLQARGSRINVGYGYGGTDESGYYETIAGEPEQATRGRGETACFRKPPPGWRIPKSWRRYPVIRKGGGGAGGNRDRGVRGVEIRRPSRVGD
ncbi:hypothetical protein B2J93_3557 [Marssonina coronariae]|uniref:Uncharacterized protein n=1 Tax=Diplocarpon coronariae TaxID=2795749 RepID=A0A218Z4M9_9HELO|nr:hypothetical protein B2J93_3557 [Marssonina coronariae]